MSSLSVLNSMPGKSGGCKVSLYEFAVKSVVSLARRYENPVPVLKKLTVNLLFSGSLTKQKGLSATFPGFRQKFPAPLKSSSSGKYR